MAIDLRRCAEAAAHAALAEAFAPPEPKRRRRRRLRPVRALLVATGLFTALRAALNPELRRKIFEALAARFPIEELLDELVLDADVVPDAEGGREAAGADGESDHEESGDAGDEAGAQAGPTESPNQRRRRRSARARGDTNGQHGRKPPSRGTRA